MLLESVIHSGPITALYYEQDYILSGIGSFLHVYTSHRGEGWTESAVTEILPGRNIHGIKSEKKGSNRIITFGQKCMRLIEYDNKQQKINLLQGLVEFSDWIWDITWLQDKANQVCLALGHNVVVTFDLTTQRLLQTVQCSEQCILYCAKFVANTSDTIVLAAGTVFNEVVLWSPVCHKVVNERLLADSFHRLTGHQGVIFSIDYNSRLQKLCSASDDRSLRLYKVDFPSDVTQPGMSDWLEMKCSLLHVLYGHQARVWDGRLLNDVVISVGEDSTCCVWSYEGKVIQKFKGHRGKSIWSTAVADTEDRVVTGGGDHSIRVWRLQSESEPPVQMSSVIDLKMSFDDFPRNTMFLDFSRILAITNQGNLLLYNCDTADVTCLMSDSEFSSYTVMAVSKTKHLIIIGNIKGVIRVLHIGEAGIQNQDTLCVDQKIYNGNVFSVHFVTDDMVITTGPDGDIKIWHIGVLTDDLSLTLLHKMNLPPSRHRWVTTACLIKDGHYIVCGDRTGSVILYKLLEPDQTSELVQKFSKIHGKAGVTHICWHGDTLYTCGRDGLYRQFTLDVDDGDDDDDDDDGSCVLKCQNSNRVYKGFEWLEKMVFSPDGNMEVFGFHTNMFVIWNVNQNQRILEIECGGGHRTWDYTSTGSQNRYGYIKAREVKVVDIAIRSNQTVVKPSIHGREICDVKHLHSENHTNGNSLDVLITCSEDTTLNIMLVKYTNNIPDFSILHTLSGHISSVRCIAISSSKSGPKGKRSWLVMSGGGRAQIRVWRIYLTKQETDLQSKYGHLTSDGRPLCSKTLSGEQTGKLLCRSDFTSNIDDTEGSHSEYVVSSVNKTIDSTKVIKDDGINTTIHTVDTTTHKPEPSQFGTNADIMSQSNICHTDIQNSSALMDQREEDSVVSMDTNKGEVSCDKQEVTGNIPQVHSGYVSLGEIRLGKAGRRTKKPWRYPIDNSDPETRILDLCLFHGQEICSSFTESLFFFAAACSDGLVRLFSFEENSRETTLISSSKYHDHCVLKTTYFIKPWKQTNKSDKESKLSQLPKEPDIDLYDSEGNIDNSEKLNVKHISNAALEQHDKEACNTQDNTISKDSKQFVGKTENSEKLDEKQNPDSVLNLLDKETRGTEDNPEYSKGRDTDNLNQVVLISAATDGIVACYDITSICYRYTLYNGYIQGDKNQTGRMRESEEKISVVEEDMVPMFDVQLHQSGINSIHCHFYDDTFVLLTGGDDNALTVTYVNVTQTIEDSMLKMEVCKTGTCVSAHSAQVTGVWWLGANMVLSVSIDQRLCLWKLQETNQTVEFVMADCKFVNVSDASNIDVFQNSTGQYVVIAGEGLQIFKVKKQNGSQTLEDTITKQTKYIS